MSRRCRHCKHQKRIQLFQDEALLHELKNQFHYYFTFARHYRAMADALARDIEDLQDKVLDEKVEFSEDEQVDEQKDDETFLSSAALVPHVYTEPDNTVDAPAYVAAHQSGARKSLFNMKLINKD